MRFDRKEGVMVVQVEGKMIAKIIFKNPKEAMDKTGTKLIEVEQELNSNVANTIYKKYGVALRFHM
jgi:hypothetical protein